MNIAVRRNGRRRTITLCRSSATSSTLSFRCSSIGPLTHAARHRSRCGMTASQATSICGLVATLGPVARGSGMDARAGNLEELDAKGHRARLRERLLDAGAAGFHDYELGEYLLTLTIPRVDTMPL